MGSKLRFLTAIIAGSALAGMSQFCLAQNTDDPVGEL